MPGRVGIHLELRASGDARPVEGSAEDSALVPVLSLTLPGGNKSSARDCAHCRLLLSACRVLVELELRADRHALRIEAVREYAVVASVLCIAFPHEDEPSVVVQEKVRLLL